MRILLAIGLLCVTSVVGAQQAQNICQTDERFSQFDFWLGYWRVTDPSGNHVGDNRVEKVEGDCLIKEHWTNVQGQTGFSMNYFNPVSGVWRQVWVSAPGVEIDYEGGLNAEGAMVLEGTIDYFSAGNSAPFRGTWSLNEDGTVRQLFEQYDSSSEQWTIWFDGLYTRKEN